MIRYKVNELINKVLSNYNENLIVLNKYESSLTLSLTLTTHDSTIVKIMARN